ncbi:hypothetical protein TI39_contig339g00018 [Zymoseptoria brevis]|uniref:F-box domain-containing protein n=1 Tax=Zymoseptoria brevis TaxID=1047168 RepID=A0A0F4GS00_9PEZI|nr:hypothetical protein TI39_contig339g00018 [Zymoseptoria brevis]
MAPSEASQAIAASSQLEHAADQANSAARRAHALARKAAAAARHADEVARQAHAAAGQANEAALQAKASAAEANTAVAQAKKTDGPIQRFRLMDLSSELRNRVYEYCVVSDEPLRLPSEDCLHYDQRPAIQPAISMTSQQVRAEVLPIFYEQNKFEYHVFKVDMPFMFGCPIQNGISLRNPTRHVEFQTLKRWAGSSGVLDFEWTDAEFGVCGSLMCTVQSVAHTLDTNA